MISDQLNWIDLSKKDPITVLNLFTIVSLSKFDNSFCETTFDNIWL